MKTGQPRIGEVYMIRFQGVGSEQNGFRPGLVFQNNVGNKFSPNIIALPLTSSIKKTKQPTHVVLRSSDTGLPRDSMVLAENPERVSKERIGQYMTTLGKDAMAEIAAAYLLATSAVSFLSADALYRVYQQAAKLNAA